MFGASHARPMFRTRDSSRFDPAHAGAYRGSAYSETDVSVENGQGVTGTTSPATASAVVSASGKIRIRTPNETLSGTLTPVADDPTFFGQAKSENPCDGLFGFTDETGTVVFVVFGADGFSYARLQRHDTWPAVRYDFSSGRAERHGEDGRLALPLADPTVLGEIHCFGIKPWGPPLAGDTRPEVHGGMDLCVSDRVFPWPSHPAGFTGPRYRIIAPTDGTVVRIESNAGKGLGSTGSARVAVVLRLNEFWFVVLSLETQSRDEGIGAAQEAAIWVRVGDGVSTGDPIGQLLTGSLEAARPPCPLRPALQEPGFNPRRSDALLCGA